MTLEVFYKKIKEALDIDIAYDHFNESPKIPFLVYVDEGENKFIADGTVYTSKRRLRLEQYTEEKDLHLEEKLRAFLIEERINFSDDGTEYIADEKLYVHYYHISI